MRRSVLFYISFLGILGCVSSSKTEISDTTDFLLYKTFPSKVSSWFKDANGVNYGNLDAVVKETERKGRNLVFAMNGGMFNKSHLPVGLYIEEGSELASLDTVTKGYGNFYLNPNGVFYITQDDKAFVKQTTLFTGREHCRLATQSGPMLVIDGKIHPAFVRNSKNVNIRNGVGILDDGNVVFAISTKKVTLHSFAEYFKELGCKNALYLDGSISKCYYPEKQISAPKEGSFGVVLGVLD